MGMTREEIAQVIVAEVKRQNDSRDPNDLGGWVGLLHADVNRIGLDGTFEPLKVADAIILALAKPQDNP